MEMPVIWAADLKGVLHYGHYKAPSDNAVMSDVDDTDLARHTPTEGWKCVFVAGDKDKGKWTKMHSFVVIY